MKSWLFLLYVLNCWYFGDQLSLTVDVHKLECLVKRLLCCIQGQGHSEGYELQWMFARTISLIDQTLYGDASSSVRVSFRYIIFLCSRSKPQPFLVSEILKLLQSQLVWWCIITTQGKTPWKDFIAFTHRAWDREYGFGDCGLDCCPSWPSWYLKQGQYPFRSRKCGNNIAFVMNIPVY